MYNNYNIYPTVEKCCRYSVHIEKIPKTDVYILITTTQRLVRVWCEKSKRKSMHVAEYPLKVNRVCVHESFLNHVISFTLAAILCVCWFYLVCTVTISV